VGLRATTVVRLVSTLAHEWAPGFRCASGGPRARHIPRLRLARCVGMQNSRRLTSRPPHVTGRRRLRSNQNNAGRAASVGSGLIRPASDAIYLRRRAERRSQYGKGPRPTRLWTTS
jgi:hypothetical protein